MTDLSSLPDELLEEVCEYLKLPDLLNLIENDPVSYHVCKKIYDRRKAQYMGQIYTGPGGGRYWVNKSGRIMYITPEDSELDSKYSLYTGPGGGRYWFRINTMYYVSSKDEALDSGYTLSIGPKGGQYWFINGKKYFRSIEDQMAEEESDSDYSD